MAFYGCSTDPGNFNPDDCNFRNGRLRSGALIKASLFATNPDFTSLAVWNTGVATGDIILLGNISGSYAEPAATEIDGTGDSDTITTSFAHEITFMHNGYVEDFYDFWNTMNTNREFHFAARVDGLSENPIHYITTKPCAFIMSPPVEAGIDTQVVWKGKAKWKAVDMPIMRDVPAGLWT